MLNPVIEILSYVTISQLVLFSIFFLSSKHGNKISNRLLASLFLCYALWISTDFLDWNYRLFFLEQVPRLARVFRPFAFCISPLLYLYTLSSVNNNFKLKPRHALLFMPFLIFISLTLERMTFQDISVIREIVIKDTFLGFKGPYEEMAVFGTIRIMNLFLATLSFIAIYGYKKKFDRPLSTMESFEYRWLLIILIGISAVFVFEAMNYIYYFTYFKIMALRSTIYFIMFLIFNSLIYSGLKKSVLLETREPNVRYSKSPLVDDQKEILMQKIMKSMVEDKIYLTPCLTVQDFAEKLGTQPRLISQVINELNGQNFINFLNSYRVEEVKKMLKDPNYKDYSIIGISLEAGFNSKTTFNTAFKKHTGLTPKEYQQQNENS